MRKNGKFSLLAAILCVCASVASAVLGYQLAPSVSPSHDVKVYTTSTTTQASHHNPAPSPLYSPASHAGSSYHPTPPHYTTTTTTPSPYQSVYESSDDVAEPAPVYDSPAPSPSYSSASHAGSSYHPAPPHYTTTTTTPSPYQSAYESSDDVAEPAPLYAVYQTTAPPAPHHGYTKPPAVYQPDHPSPSAYPSPSSYGSPNYPKPPQGGYPSPGAQPRKPKVIKVEKLNAECQPDMDRDTLDAILAEVKKQIENNQRDDITRVINLGWIGDQRNGRKPLTALRQTEALIVYPDQPASWAPQDIQDRADLLRQGFPGHSIGAYTDSAGIEVIRQHIVDFFWARDGGKKSNVSNIFMTNGRLQAFRDIFSQLRNVKQGKRIGLLMADPNNGEIGTIAKCNDICVTRYPLNEDDGWTASISVIRDALVEQEKYCTPTILYIMQPGWPIGRIHRREELEELIKLAYEKNMMILTDEGYQDDTIDTSISVLSVRKVAAEMKAPYDSLEIMTVIAASHGLLGESGQRSAAYELLNFDDDVIALIYKSVDWNNFNPNTAGQIVMDFVVNPPKRGDESWPTWHEETTAISNRIRRNAEVVYNALLEVNGLSVGKQEANQVTFIKIDFPASFVEKANSAGIQPDVLFAQLLLSRHGVKVLPGSWFLLLPNGNNHLSIALTSPTKDIIQGVEKLIQLYVAIRDEISSQNYLQPPSTTTESYATPGIYY